MLLKSFEVAIKSKTLIVAGVMMIAVTTIAFFVSIHWMHERAIDIQLEEAEKIVQAVKQHVSNQYKLMDLASKSVIEALNDRDPASIPGEELASLKAAIERPLAVYQIEVNIWLLDGTSSALGPNSINVSDSEIFRFHRGQREGALEVTNAETELFIGAPTFGRVRNEYVLPVSRPILGPDGSLRGVVSATIPSKTMLDVFALLRRAPNDVVFLMRNDQVGIARSPDDPRFNGRRLPGALIFQNYPAQQTGRFYGASATDGVRRIGAHASLAPIPLVAGFSLETRALNIESASNFVPIILVAGAQVGAIVLFLIFAVRAQARAAKERDLARSSDRELRLILDGAHDAILMLDDRMSVRIFNRAAERMFAVERDAMLGKKIDRLVPLETRPRHDKLMQNLSPGSAHVMGNWRKVSALRSTGEKFPIMASISKTETDGSPRFLAILRDMTETEIQEERLRLSLSVEEKLRITAEGANRAKSLFLASMSHELRTPLNAIIGFSEAMISGVGGKVLNPQHCEYLGYVLDSGRHLLDIINDVIDMSRIQAGEFNVEIQNVGVSDALRLSENLLSQKFVERNVRLNTSGVLPDSVVKADLRALRQILINLLSNAIKFSPKNSIVTVDMQSIDGIVILRVRDQGPGIAAEVMAQLGRPFIQDRSQTVSNNEGVGLGLAISISLAEKMGGTLSFQNRAEGGLDASLSLPEGG